MSAAITLAAAALITVAGISTPLGKPTPIAATAQYEVFGYGRMACGTFASSKSGKLGSVADRIRSGAEEWVLGYFSAANWYQMRLPPGGPITPDAVFSWVDDYCRRHPDDRLKIAALALVASTKPAP